MVEVFIQIEKPNEEKAKHTLGEINTFMTRDC